MTEEEKRLVCEESRSGLSARTRDNHEKAWRMWERFLAARTQDGSRHPDPFLNRCSKEDAGFLLMLFIQWLRREEKISHGQIPGTISNLKSNWISANQGGDCFQTVTGNEMARALKAVRPSETEVRATMARQRDAEKFPAPSELVTSRRQAEFLDQLAAGPSTATLDRAGGYLAAVLTQETAQRGIN